MNIKFVQNENEVLRQQHKLIYLVTILFFLWQTKITGMMSYVF